MKRPRAGMGRLMNCGTLAVTVLAAQATIATAQIVRAAARAKSDSLVKADSVKVATRRPGLMIVLKKIDSLVRLQNEMTIGSPEYARLDEELRKAIQAALPNGVVVPENFTVKFAPGTAEAARRTQLSSSPSMIDGMKMEPRGWRGWLGIRTDGLVADPWQEPDGWYIRYFVYPMVVEVQPNSPAAKVGIQFGDSLISYDGIDLRRNGINLTRKLEPGRPLKVSLRRDGETKDVSIIPEETPPNVVYERRATAVAGMLVPGRGMVMIPDSMERRFVERRMAAQGGGGRAMSGGMSGGTVARAPMATAGTMVNNWILGARITDLESAAVLVLTQQKESHGVLVTQVPVGSPAAKMGLRGGDMIIAVGDVDVISMSQLHHAMNAQALNAAGLSRAIPIVVSRQGKTEKLVYEPR